MTVFLAVYALLVTAAVIAGGITLADHRRKLAKLKTRAAASVAPPTAAAPTDPVRAATARTFGAQVRTPVCARSDDVADLFWLGQTRYDGTLAVEPCPDPPPPQSLLYWNGAVPPPGPTATRYVRLERLIPRPDVYVAWDTFLTAFDPAEVPSPAEFAGLTWTREAAGWRVREPAAAPGVSCTTLELAQSVWCAHRTGQPLPAAADRFPADGLWVLDPDGRLPSIAGQAALCLALHEAGRTAAAEIGVTGLREQLSLWLGPEWHLRRGPHPAPEPAAEERAAAAWLFGLYVWRKDVWFARAAWRLSRQTEPPSWLVALEEANRFRLYPLSSATRPELETPG